MHFYFTQSYTTRTERTQKHVCPCMGSHMLHHTLLSNVFTECVDILCGEMHLLLHPLQNQFLCPFDSSPYQGWGHFHLLYCTLHWLSISGSIRSSLLTQLQGKWHKGLPRAEPDRASAFRAVESEQGTVASPLYSIRFASSFVLFFFHCLLTLMGYLIYDTWMQKHYPLIQREGSARTSGFAALSLKGQRVPILWGWVSTVISVPEKTKSENKLQFPLVLRWHSCMHLH